MKNSLPQSIDPKWLTVERIKNKILPHRKENNCFSMLSRPNQNQQKRNYPHKDLNAGMKTVKQLSTSVKQLIICTSSFASSLQTTPSIHDLDKCNHHHYSDFLSF